jgi:hypothetical protein
MYLCKVCVCVCVCVCDERGGGSMSAAVKVKSLNPFAEGGGGAQPIMNDQETILVVQKFNTRGLALAEIKLISLFYKVHEKT